MPEFSMEEIGRIVSLHENVEVRMLEDVNQFMSSCNRLFSKQLLQILRPDNVSLNLYEKVQFNNIEVYLRVSKGSLNEKITLEFNAPSQFYAEVEVGDAGQFHYMRLNIDSYGTHIAKRTPFDMLAVLTCMLEAIDENTDKTKQLLTLEEVWNKHPDMPESKRSGSNYALVENRLRDVHPELFEGNELSTPQERAQYIEKLSRAITIASSASYSHSFARYLSHRYDLGQITTENIALCNNDYSDKDFSPNFTGDMPNTIMLSFRFHPKERQDSLRQNS